MTAGPTPTPTPVRAFPTQRVGRWSATVVRARHLVVGAWVLTALLGLASASGLSGLLTTPLTIPGSDSAIADRILLEHFGQSVAGTFTVIVPIGAAGEPVVERDEALIDAAAHHLRSGRVTDQHAVSGLLYANVSTSLGLSGAAAETVGLRHRLATSGLRGALVTGPPALQHDLTPVLAGDLRRGEVLAAVLAAVLLVLVLGLSGAAVVPLVVAALTIGVDIGVTYLVAHRVTMVLYTPNVIELIALGLAIDYSLLIVHRFRHELTDPDVSVERALAVTMATAGRTVLVSSGVVAIGLAVLAAVPVPFLRSLGAAGLVVPIVAALAALTLLPALLAALGRRGVRPVAFSGLVGGEAMTGRWARLARSVVSRPRRTLAAALTLLALCGTSLAWLQLTPGSTSAIPPGLASARALSLLSHRVGPGVISPDQIVIDLGAAHRATSKAAQADVLALARGILNDPEVFAEAIGDRAPFADRSGRYEQILVVGRHQLGAAASQSLVRRLRERYVARAHLGPGAHAYVGGAPAQGLDFLDAVYGAAPWIVLAALLIAFVVLARAFRSLVLAGVSVALNLVSVAAALGLLVLFTRFGVGVALLGTYQVSQVEGWVPVFLFAVLFGLSMDYEVFLVSRMRESHDEGLTTREAIVTGVARTGGVVSAAALILVGAMLGLVFGHVAGLQELGVGLALGILIDATVVRALVLPSVMTLLGRWNWWLPEPAARLLRTTASPLETRGARPGVPDQLVT
jgi:RND superfamily putative drug exporter